MTRDELLLKLRDIEPPPEPPWWLIGPAWLWLAGALLALATAAWWWWQRRRDGRLLRLAREELRSIHADYRADGNARRLAYRVSGWLKQVALLAYPAHGLQRVSGDEWLRFLDRDLAEKPFSEGCGRIFGGRLYQRDIEFDADRVVGLCDRWLGSVGARLRHRGSAR